MALHDVTVELFYSGAWHDHTADVYTGDADAGADITITHGQASWSGGIAPAAAPLVFRSWTFNPDNVTSPLYGLIGRNTPVRITVDGDRRFYGEVASWAPEQSLGGDVQAPQRWVSVEPGGQLRRIQAGTDPLPSSLRSAYDSAVQAPVAYWPLESGLLSSVGLPAAGPAPFELGPGQFEPADVAVWLEPGVGIRSGVFVAGAVTMPAAPTRWAVDHMRRAGTVTETREMDLFIEGNSENSSEERFDWVLDFNPSDNELNFVQLFQTPGLQTSDLLDTITVDIYDDQPHHVRLDLAQDGTGIDWDITIDGESISTGTIASSTLQGISKIVAVDRAGPGPAPCAFSHIAVFNGTPAPIADITAAAFGYPGETAGDRFLRVSPGSNTVFGDPSDTVPMGPQPRGSLAEQYADIAATDDGIVFDFPQDTGVAYRTGRSRYNQDPTLTLDYDAYEVAPPLRPVLDDKAIRNDITATRRGGQSFRVVDEASIAAVGRYTGKPEVNVAGDLALEAPAGWALHIGTASGTRLAEVTVDLDACPHLKDDVVATSIGDRIDLVNLPAELTPNAAQMIVIGWTELAAADRRKVTFRCVPEAPFHIAEVEHTDYGTVGATTATVSGLFNTVNTMLSIDVGEDGPWVHEADFDIVIAGERMTVLDVDEPSAVFDFPNQRQTITVRRSRNGVGKFLEDDPVSMFDPTYIGL